MTLNYEILLLWRRQHLDFSKMMLLGLCLVHDASRRTGCLYGRCLTIGLSATRIVLSDVNLQPTHKSGKTGHGETLSWQMRVRISGAVLTTLRYSTKRIVCNDSKPLDCTYATDDVDNCSGWHYAHQTSTIARDDIKLIRRQRLFGMILSSSAIRFEEEVKGSAWWLKKAAVRVPILSCVYLRDKSKTTLNASFIQKSVMEVN